MLQNEKIIETKQCKNCSCSFEITDKDLEFYEKVSPVFAGIKYNIPSPTLCPECRQQRRLSFRNEREIYKRKCDFSGKDIISIYSSDKPYKVYSQDIWWSDKWDALDYGRDFDFNKSFSEQFGELIKEMPKISLLAVGNTNSEYVNSSSYNNNSYLLFESDYNEDCYYLGNSFWNKDSISLAYSNHLQNSYNCIDCFYSYNLKHSLLCYSCNNSSYLFNCYNCNNCFKSSNLNNKEFVFENQQLTEQEYKEKVKGIINFDFQLEKTKPVKFISGIKNESVSGDYLNNCKNLFFCFDCSNSQDCKYISNCDNTKDCYDIVGYGGDNGMNLCYEGQSAGNGVYNILFCNNIWENSNYVLYSDFCRFSSNLFGCNGLNNKSYCILNKQYTKEEYEKLVPKIIEHMISTGEWGEFFPSSISQFGYNETLADEYFPLSKEEAFSRGFNWSNYEQPFPKVEKIIGASKLPENIADIPDDILNWAIECEITKKPFRIIRQELEFYRKHNLPIPRRHPDQRHLDRMALRNPRKLFDRKCDKCGIDMKTTYSPERPEIVYCEECYILEVY